MAYTANLCDTVTITSSGETICGSGGGITSYEGDGYTYYISATFTKVGSAELRFYGYVPSGSAFVRAYAAETSATFNSSTGWPSPYITYGQTTALKTDERALAFTVNVSSTPKTYRFYFRNTSNNMALVFPVIRFTESSTPLWDDEYESLGRITSVYSNTISPADPYTIYCFRATFNEAGTIKFSQPSGATTYMYITDQYNNALYDHTTGRIAAADCLDWRWGPGDLEISIGSGSFYFWIRHLDGSTTSDISFTISPPGSVWSVNQFANTEQITTDGKTWYGLSEHILLKSVEYIPVTFSTAGSYTLSYSGSDRVYGYLTSNLSIDNGGFPQNVVASDESSSTGFSFSATVSTNTTYYLMFRTASGEKNNYSFNISVTYSGGGGGGGGTWYINSENLGTRTTQYQNYHTYAAYTLYRKVVRFSQAGTVTFYSSASTTQETADPRGWITNHVSTYNRDDGTPPSSATILADNDNGAGNRQFTMTATVAANTDYDFWFRLYDGSKTGYTYIYIDPPSSAPTTWQCNNRTSDSSLTNLSANVSSKSCTVNAAYVAKYVVSFASSGTATFTSSGSIAVSGYIGATDSGFYTATGIPVVYDTHNVGNNNFTFSLNVTAGTTYYLWIKGNDATVSGTTYFSITVPSGGSWSYNAASGTSTISSTRTFTANFSERVGYKMRMGFTTPGVATVFTIGGVMDIGYIGASDTGFDPSTGVPYYYDQSDPYSSKDGTNYMFTLTVTTAATYTLWSRAKSASDSGQVSIIVVPPNQWSYLDQSSVSVSTTLTTSLTMNYATGFCFPITFTSSGSAEFKTTGSLDTVGYLAVSTKDSYSPADGVPTVYSLTDDNSGSGNNFSISLSVTPGTTYYLWVKGKNASVSGSVSVTITLTASSSGGVWIYTDAGWKNATVYIYTDAGWKIATPYIYTDSGWKQTT